MTLSKLEADVDDQIVQRITPITGSVQPLNLDGNQEPLVQVILKLNEVIDWVNKQ